MKNNNSRVRVSQRKCAAPTRTPVTTLSRDSVIANIEMRNERMALVRAHLPEAPPQSRMCASGARALDRLLGVLGKSSTVDVREAGGLG